MSKDKKQAKESTIPTVSEESSTLGDIRINHSVVASIVRLAALEVSGVAAVGGSFVDGITEIFSKKGGESGVRVDEDEVGDYRIEARVILRFGVELATVAGEIQQRIAEQVQKMLDKAKNAKGYKASEVDKLSNVADTIARLKKSLNASLKVVKEMYG